MNEDPSGNGARVSTAAGPMAHPLWGSRPGLVELRPSVQAQPIPLTERAPQGEVFPLALTLDREQNRLWLAGQAMAGLLVHAGAMVNSGLLAHKAVELADALLTELGKTKRGG